MITRFDSSRAWRDASAALAANREVLLAIAGVFFVVPWLAFLLFAPEPPLRPDMEPEQARAAMQAYLPTIFPYLLPLLLVQASGMMAVLVLCGDRTRPTVREAIGRGVAGVLPYIGAQLLFGLGFMLAAMGVSIVLGASRGAAGIAGIALNVGLLYATIRLLPVTPVIAIERLGRPWQVLVRAWRLTRGQVARILLFVALLVVAGMVLMAVAGMVLGTVATLLGGPEAGRVAEAVASAATIGLFLLVIAGVLAAMHDQLAVPAAAPD